MIPFFHVSSQEGESMRGLIKQVLIVLSLLVSAAALANDLGMVRLSLIEGDVQVLIQDTADWTAAAINLPLCEGDRMWVPDNGRAELQLQGGVYVRSDADTALDVLTMTGDSAQFYLDRGHVYINNRRGGIKTVQIDTPMSSIRSYNNSIMMIDVSEDGMTEVSALKGYIYVESHAGATRVAAGNILTIRGESSADMAPLGSPDDWERWNMDRDRNLTAWGESSRYLPDELHEYSSDFDDNGRWQYATAYGYVWTPTAIAAGWAPYSSGRWLWIHGNYVWVDYNRWSWVPCHYGRWVFISSYGWSWVPPSAGDIYWGPGYVGWIVTPAYVAWVPLAPGEIYYGYGDYGPWSRNIATVKVNTIANRRYTNARATNSVTVVQRESFGTGRRIPANIRKNPFLDEKQRPGRDIRIVPPPGKPRQPIMIAPVERGKQVRNLPQPPVRERTRTAAPASRTIPETRTEKSERSVLPPAVSQPMVQKPPERVRKTRPEEIKKERRLVKDRDASVFRPQPPENLPVKKMNEPKVSIRKPSQPRKKVNQGEGGERQQIR